MAVSDKQRQENEARQHRKARRGFARVVAKARAADAYNELIAEVDPSEWDTAEEMDAYRDELICQRDRVNGPGPRTRISARFKS